MRDALSAIEERLDDNTARALANAVSQAVRDGKLVEGQSLPPIRAVARELAVSPTTVSAAWRTLARAGLIRTDGRRGTTITPPARPRPDRYGRVVGGVCGIGGVGAVGGVGDRPLELDLSTGVPDVRLLPDMAPAFARLSAASVPRSYLDPPVLPQLDQALQAAWPYDARTLSVVDGAMDGLSLVMRTALRYGDKVAVEHPTFPPIVDLLESIGATAVGVPMDEDGILVDRLGEVIDQGAAVVILQPRAQNPTGVCLSPQRARRVATMARERGLLIVEDDSMGDVSSVEPVSVGTWAPDQVVHIRSFSKSHGPDLRLAAMSAPAELMGELLARRQLGQGWSSRLLQRVLLDLLSSDASIESVQRAKVTYRDRRARVVDLLAAQGVRVDGSDGINLWVPVRDEAAALVRLGSAGIGAAPGTPFAVAAGMEPHVRVTIGLVPDVDLERVAEELVAASRATSWSARQR